MDATLADRCAREIEELHAFFQRWFRAELPDTDEAFARFTNVLDAGFRMISPDGSDLSREHVLSAVRRGHGRMSDPPVRIWIEAHGVCVQTDELAVVTYQEWQELEGRSQGRVSVARFSADPGAPNGVRWMHVQEVWLEESDQATERPSD
jgi:hypothetical protein